MVRLAGHVAGSIGGKQDRHAYQLFGAAGTLHGDALPQPERPGRMVPGDLRQVGQDMAGADGVGSDAILGELNGHGPGQGYHTALGGAVDGASAQHPLVIVGADIDDAAGAALVHLPGHRLAHEEQALQVGVHDAVIVRLLHVQKALPLVDPGHIEQHVDLAVFGHDLIHTGVDAVQAGDVQLVNRGGAAFGNDPVRQGRALGGCAVAQGNLRSGAEQALTDSQSDAAAGAGDHNGLAFQAEEGREIAVTFNCHYHSILSEAAVVRTGN